MERRKISVSHFISPSSFLPSSVAAGSFHHRCEPACGSSSQVGAENFSDPNSNPKAPKSEIIWFDLSTSVNDVVKYNYELCPLPDLLSFEHPVPDPAVAMLPHPPLSISTSDLVPVVESSNKRFRSSSAFYPLPPPLNSNTVGVRIPRPRRTPLTEISRRRRSKISERIKILEGLMPSNTKMPMAKLLEEAHRYIKFLEAQVTALQTMPVQSARFQPVGFDPSGRFGGLEMLNRHQMLQVMVNSSMVQSLLYRKGCCVFSEEQVAELRRLVVEGRSPAMLPPEFCASASRQDC